MLSSTLDRSVEISSIISAAEVDTSKQICIALKRILVHEKIFDDFKVAIVEATKQLKMGEGNEPDVFLGPIQNSMQYERVRGFFQDVKMQKYDVAVGGENPTGPGYFITPTIIDRPTEDSRLVLEEPFGMFISPLLTYQEPSDEI